MEGDEQQPQPIQVLCPHCRQKLAQVGWLIDANAGLITFYHNEAFCMAALNFQLVPPAPQRIMVPPEFIPMGRG